MTIIEILEERVLAAADKIAEDAKDQGTKTLVNLFKSAVLKKYKDVYDKEAIIQALKREYVKYFMRR